MGRPSQERENSTVTIAVGNGGLHPAGTSEKHTECPPKILHPKDRSRSFITPPISHWLGAHVAINSPLPFPDYNSEGLLFAGVWISEALERA